MAAARDDEFLTKLLAQIENLDIENVRARRVALVVEMFVERGAGDDCAAMEREVFEQDEFAGGERDRFARARDGARVTVRAAVSMRTSPRSSVERAYWTPRRMMARKRAKSSALSKGLIR